MEESGQPWPKTQRKKRKWERLCKPQDSTCVSTLWSPHEKQQCCQKYKTIKVFAWTVRAAIQKSAMQHFQCQHFPWAELCLEGSSRKNKTKQTAGQFVNLTEKSLNVRWHSLTLMVSFAEQSETFVAIATMGDVCPLRGVLLNSDMNATWDEYETKDFLNKLDH